MTIDQFNILFDIRNDMAGLIASESRRALRASQINAQRENSLGMMLGSQKTLNAPEAALRGSEGNRNQGGKNDPR